MKYLVWSSAKTGMNGKSLIRFMTYSPESAKAYQEKLISEGHKHVTIQEKQQ